MATFPVIPADFTNPDVFVSYLSSFWTRVFQDSEAVRGLVGGDSLQLAQLQRDFVEILRGAGISGTPPLHQERYQPVFLRQSTLSTGPAPLAYGQGETYGPQPVGGPFQPGFVFTYGAPERRSPTWYHALPAGVQSLGGTLVNRPFDPSVVLVEGSDYAVQATGTGTGEGDASIVVFTQNPFDNPLLAQRVVSGDAAGTAPGTADREICLFALDARIEAGDLQNRYGYAFFAAPPLSGEPYRVLLAALMRLYSGGPTVAALDAFFAAACGVPLTREAAETVELAAPQPDGSTVVVTSAGVYPVPAGLTLRPGVVPGAVLAAGTPLTTATEVWDHRTAPTQIYAQHGVAIGADFLPGGGSRVLSAGLGFPNDPVPVLSGYPADVIATAEGPRCSGRFALVGAPADVAAFWAQVQGRSEALAQTGGDVFFADRLWRSLGVVDGSGEPDYTQSVFLNPLEFLYDNFLCDGLIGVSLSVTPTPVLLASFKHLREALPPTRTLMIFIRPGEKEDIALTVDPTRGIDPTDGTPLDERGVLRGDLSSAAPATLEALSGPNAVADALGFGQAPALQTDTVDFGNGTTSASTVRGVTFPVC